MKDKISGYELDNEQQKIVLDEANQLLVVAGAGSGKTLTILGKINYLIKYKNINPNSILCISFTKKAADSLKQKIKTEFSYDMPVYTFHKLSLEILKESENYEIADSDTLENIIHEFFRETIFTSNYHLKLILKYFGLKTTKDYQKFYQSNETQIIQLEKLLTTFIHLFKCNNYQLPDFSKFLKIIGKTFSYKKYKKEKTLLIIALNIYIMYQNYLEENKEIDFDDMLIKATNQVKEKGISKNYQYIIIDEYQDTSYIRFLLVKAIIEKTNAKLMVVGDDFQSIYRFTGCELDLFLNFKEYFPESKIMKIQNTYRNSQELIKVAGDFVMKNKSQIKKNLKSSKSLTNPIEIIYYQDIKKEFKTLIEKINKETKKPIMILGRNNKDINLVLTKDMKLLEDGKLIYKENESIKLYYLTIHKSKGLEEENVIIINLRDDILGLPSKIEDEKLFRLVSKNKEKYPYSEERRLFYVAITRTKNKVYLLVPNKNKSIFIKEIEKLI